MTIGIYYAKTARYQPTKEQIFRRFVLNPIPKSVIDIQADCHEYNWYGDYVYVLRFGINRTDLDIIANTYPFKRVYLEDFETNGELRWCNLEKPEVTITFFGRHSYGGIHYNTEIYGPDEQQPSWLDLGVWQNPEMYVYEEETGRDGIIHRKILIYNKDLGYAYLIDKNLTPQPMFGFKKYKDTYEWK
ncbi:MAG: hypothetical protein JW715_11150 [Sedimentisphaerales bacterium]|nr:hypothetical protein [Sedimentisphaerales bacterium]